MAAARDLKEETEVFANTSVSSFLSLFLGPVKFSLQIYYFGLCIMAFDVKIKKKHLQE